MRTPFALLIIAALAAAPSAAQEPENDAATVARARAHYARVEAELRSRDTSDLSAAQCEARERLIVALHAYRERASFGRNAFEPAARVPQFVDFGGRRCAVAELLHSTGRDDLVDAVSAQANEAWVVDLATEREFVVWLEANGLELAEAARIQLPSTELGFGNGAQSGKSGGTHSKAPPGYKGPGDTTPPGGSSTGGSGAPPSNGPGAAPTRPSGVPTPPNAPQSPLSPFLPATVAAKAAADADWTMWWEYNKLTYLEVSPFTVKLALRTGPETAADRTRLLELELEQLRGSFRTLLRQGMANGDALVRARATVACGRLESKSAIEALKPAFADSNVSVRHAAILALGAIANDEAYELLCSIAEHGSLPKGESISASARAYAVFALAVGRLAGFDDRADREVARVVRSRGTDAARVAIAALMYQSLAPCAELEPLALELADDKSEPMGVRCRAVEALTSSPSDELLSKLQRWLSGPDLELRRSAAAALGAFRHPLALAPLMTAYEIEIEPVTRGFALISIGQQGGAAARAFLIAHLQRDDSNARPWAALALGILARDADDEVARRAIREAAAKERDRDVLPAYWLASGVARDASAVDDAARSLAGSGDPRLRGYAATALALMGDERARSALLVAWPGERSTSVRVAIAQALGYFGRSADARVLVQTLKSLREPELAGLAAVAMGFHGTSEALSGLSVMLEDSETRAAARAAAYDGLGMLLSRHKPLELARASRHSNYTIYEDWLDDVFQCTL